MSEATPSNQASGHTSNQTAGHVERRSMAGVARLPYLLVVWVSGCLARRIGLLL